MSNATSKKDPCSWYPTFERTQEEAIELLDTRCNVSIVSNTIQIDVEKADEDNPPKDSACLWIDEEHVYLRRNWAEWHTVDTSSLTCIRKLMQYKRCIMAYVKDKKVEQQSIPIYQISEFPEMLFEEKRTPAAIHEKDIMDETCEGWSVDDGVLPELLKARSKKIEGVKVFPNINLEGAMADFAIASDTRALIFRIWRESDMDVTPRMEADLQKIKKLLIEKDADIRCQMILLTDHEELLGPQDKTILVLSVDELLKYMKHFFL
jgi:hypothetical protein